MKFWKIMLLKKIRNTFLYVLLIGFFGLLGLEMPKILKSFTPAFSEAKNEMYLAQTQSKVVMYSTSWCQYCQKTKEYFKLRNIQVFELDIEKSKIGLEQYNEMAQEGIPLVLIGNRRIVGFQPEIFQQSLEKFAIK